MLDLLPKPCEMCGLPEAYCTCFKLIALLDEDRESLETWNIHKLDVYATFSPSLMALIPYDYFELEGWFRKVNQHGQRFEPEKYWEG